MKTHLHHLMKTHLLTLCAAVLTLTSFSTAAQWELSLPNEERSSYELVCAPTTDTPVAIIQHSFLSNRVIRVTYYLDRLDCIAITVTERAFQFDQDAGDWAVDDQGNRIFTETVIRAYPHEKQKLGEIKELLGGSSGDLFAEYTNKIKPHLKRK